MTDRSHCPEEPLHIAYLHYQYGADTALHHVEQFARAARSLGHRVDVHAMNLAPAANPAEGTTAGASFAARSRATLKRHLGRYLHEPKELLWNLRYVRRELALLEKDPPDVLLVRDHLLTASCVPVARRLGLPLVLEVNAPAAQSRLYFDNYLHLPWLPERLERWKLERADAITVVSTALQQHLASVYSVSAAKMVVVPNGADLDLFHPALTPDPGLPAQWRSAPVVGFVGSFQKWHGSDLLAGLALEVGRRHPASRFLFVGDGPEHSQVEGQTAELGERIYYPGRVPHERVPGLVAAMAVAVMPESNFYGSPLKVVEFMAAGRAVVAPRYGPLEELIDGGVDGLLFPPGDAEALAAAVLRLLDEPELRMRLANAAAQRVANSLTWRHNAERVLSACRLARERHAAKARTPGRPLSRAEA